MIRCNQCMKTFEDENDNLIGRIYYNGGFTRQND